MPAKVSEEALPPETLLADRKNMLYMGTTISTGGLLELLQQQECKPNLGKLLVILLKQKLPRRL